MNNEQITKKEYASLFSMDGMPKFSEAFPLALQHVVAMIVGCVTPAIIVASAAGLSPDNRVILIQASLLSAAFGTAIQLFPIGKRSGFHIGAGLPVILGASFCYVPSMTVVAKEYGIGAIFGAQIVGAVFIIIVGLFIKKIRHFFPPLVAGTVVFTIGISLYPIAINYMAGGLGQPTYGSWQNWVVAIFTLIVVTGITHFGKGIFKLASILFGMIAGYILALCMGMVHFGNVMQADLFNPPQIMHFGITFPVSAIISMSVIFIINAIQAIGDFSATTAGAMNREPSANELHGALVGLGCANIIGSFFGFLPTSTYGQNVGIVTTTKVVNRATLGIAALIILCAGLLPKFSALLTTIPPAVLGGATVSVFASISITGIKLALSEGANARNSAIIGLSLALGVGLANAPQTLALFPAWVMTIFGTTPVVLASIVAIVLNQILPKPPIEYRND